MLLLVLLIESCMPSAQNAVIMLQVRSFLLTCRHRVLRVYTALSFGKRFPFKQVEECQHVDIHTCSHGVVLVREKKQASLLATILHVNHKRIICSLLLFSWSFLKWVAPSLSRRYSPKRPMCGECVVVTDGRIFPPSLGTRFGRWWDSKILQAGARGCSAPSTSSRSCP